MKPKHIDRIYKWTKILAEEFDQIKKELKETAEELHATYGPASGPETVVEDESISTTDDVAKIQTISSQLRDQTEFDERVNAALQTGWKILLTGATLEGVLICIMGKRKTR